jgi:N-acetylglucosamine kinase-like BadF-type ATPase
VAEQAELALEALNDAVVCIGLSGVTFPYDAAVELPREFAKLEVEVAKLICTGDVEIVFLSHALSDQGSSIICGMGSTAYVVNGTSHIRFGGWGPALDDEGSGYWMGSAALRAIAENHDMRDSKQLESSLWEKIQNWFDRPDPDVPEWREAGLVWRRIMQELDSRKLDIRTGIFQFSAQLAVQSHWLWRSVASSLTIPLMEAFEEGDPVAITIVEDAADLLSEQLSKACFVAGVPIDHGPLVLYGGVFTYHSCFRELVIAKLEEMGHCRLKVLGVRSEGTIRPACGALLFALGGSETGRLRLPARTVIERVTSEVAKPAHKEELIND